MAEQAVGGRFEPVVDGIECAKTGQRGTVVQRLVAPVCFGDKDGARLGPECDQIGGGRVGMNTASMTPAMVA